MGTLRVIISEHRQILIFRIFFNSILAASKWMCFFFYHTLNILNPVEHQSFIFFLILNYMFKLTIPALERQIFYLLLYVRILLYVFLYLHPNQILFFVKSLKIFYLSKINIYFLNTSNFGCGIQPPTGALENSIPSIRKSPSMFNCDSQLERNIEWKFNNDIFPCF